MGRLRRLVRIHSPGQAVVLAFAIGIAVGTALLVLPFARTGGDGVPLLTALFTSTSAVCVTGMIVVDTPTYWSGFGEAVILVLVQIGGLGITTVASLLALSVFRHLGLTTRLSAQAETRALDLGDVRRVLAGAVAFALVFEVLTAVVLTLRFGLTYDEPFWRALYLGVFHAVSAYNNAGFALFTANLIPFAGDALVLVPVALAVIAGGLGFPVLFELWREWRSPRRWSLHTRIVLWASGALIVAGTLLVTALEWSNDETLGGRPALNKLLLGFFHAVMPRTAGFNAIDYADVEQPTSLVTDWLMFVGGAPASAAGGVKVTTFAILAYIVLAEVRGDPDVNAWRRRLPRAAQRQALSIALLGFGLVMASTLALLVISPFALDRLVFEAVSAFGTVGLSTGITAQLPASGQLILVALMFVGRIGPIALATALALRSRPMLYRLPEERPIVG